MGMSDHRWADSAAAQMLAVGLKAAAVERRLSLREIGRRLGYKQPVVLSHMATGRVPIPLDRAPDIAREVGLPAGPFLLAVLAQRHPDVDWELLTGNVDPFATELERTAGKPLSVLSPAHHRVLRDVVRDSEPEERWLSITEISAIRLLRELFPRLHDDGLTADDRDLLRLLPQFRTSEVENIDE
jgi:DNA-binding transcriptional regulator YdaS (Cro superfamily)